MSIESATTEPSRCPGLEAPRALGASRGEQRALARSLTVEAADGVLGQLAPGLAAAIAEKLGVELGEIVLEDFPNGETYRRSASRSAALTSSSSRPAAHPLTGT